MTKQLLLLLLALGITQCTTTPNQANRTAASTVDGTEKILAPGVKALQQVPTLWTPSHVYNVVDPFFVKNPGEVSSRLGSIDGITYKIKDEELPNYRLTKNEDFGVFNVSQGGQSIFSVASNRYVVAMEDQTPIYGLRYLPMVSRNKPDFTPNSNDKVDNWIRKSMGLAENDPFVSIIYYFHPEYTGGGLDQIQTDDGYTHMGAYIGKGHTRNAPLTYHDDTWWDIGHEHYPPNIVKLTYDGAKSQADFHKNWLIPLRILNETSGGVNFSRLSYKKDYFDANNLKNILDFYRAWIDNTWVRSEADGEPFFNIIKRDLRYDTYCAEHTTMTLNIALNIIHTKEGFVEAFGSNADQVRLKAARQADGALKGGEFFWEKIQQTWITKFGSEVPVVNKDNITALWKMPGMNHPGNYRPQRILRGSPIKDGEAQFIDYPGFALAWAPQTLGDLVAGVVAQYGRFDRIGKDGAKAVLKNFEKVIAGRVTFKDVRLQPGERNSVASTPVEKISALMAPFYALIDKHADSMAAVGPVVAYENYKKEAGELMETYRIPERIGIDPVKSFYYYSSPFVINRIIKGLQRYDKHINIEILGTVIPANQLDTM